MSNMPAHLSVEILVPLIYLPVPLIQQCPPHPEKLESTPFWPLAVEFFVLKALLDQPPTIVLRMW